ncbi:hypothetical protein DYB32_009390 [Aphanomyces invadans]|uniref:Temptin Cys/Cys disulfide domain-containing protein n=1 Tax=Aphanomyces invadans TaxID=157072 RepID=A0A3R6Y1K7_9STRA|nr:hypothetical protein DYB32_009390 [Aphanomyces invadans]
MRDSDGDGLTNGQELGDPCCIWTKGAIPNQTVGLSDPGLGTSARNKTDATIACPEKSHAMSLEAFTPPSLLFLVGMAFVGMAFVEI